MLQPPQSKLADMGTVDWMVRRSAYRKLAIHSPHGICQVDLYTDGIPYPRGNTQCQEYYSLSDPAENHTWCGKSFWANPPFINTIIHRMLMKMLQDFWKDPNNTSFTVVLRKSETAAWWPLTYHFQEIAYIPAGTPHFFSRPRAGTYAPHNLTDAGEEGGADRVFIDGAPFDTIVLFKDATTRPRMDPHQYLHACLGHYSSGYISHLMSQGHRMPVPGYRLSTRTLSTLLDLAGCAHCFEENAKRPGPFNLFDRPPPQSLPPTVKPIKWADSQPFQHIFADIWGPCRPPGFDESLYISAFKCPVTKKAFAFSSSTKGGQHIHLQEVLDDIRSHNYHPTSITFHTDNANEYTSVEMTALLRQYSIRHEPGPPYMHEFQAQIEVLWRDMQKVMNTIMRTYDAPLGSWPLAALHSINTILNVMPNRHIHMDTPHHRYTGKHYDYTQLRPFWARCYVWQDPAQRADAGALAATSAKLQDKAKPYHYVGNQPSSVYLCYDPSKGKLKALSRPRFALDYDLMSKTLHNSGETLADPASATVFTRKLYPIRKPNALTSPDILDTACSKQDTETFAYVKVQCATLQHPVWVKLLHYLQMSPEHYTTIIRYLRHQLKHGSINPHYPCFAMGSAKPPDRQKYHPAIIVSVDHNTSAQRRYQVFFDPSLDHSTAYADTDAVILDPALKAMFLALRDADSTPEDFPDDIFMDEPDPISISQAEVSPNRRHWFEALQAEIDGILHPDRSDPVTSFPKGATVLPTKLVFKLKKLPSGQVDKFKVRCTTRGDMDRTFYEEAETFAPTPQLTTFRLFLALCLIHQLMPYHYDVSQAFLQAPIPEDERYFIRFPKGYTHPKGYIGAYMKMALYGHRTSGRLWAETAHAFITDRFPSLIRSTYDECLYLGEVQGEKLMVQIYVDDFLVATACERVRAMFHSTLMTTFTATYSGILQQFLQLKISVTTAVTSTGATIPVRIDVSHDRYIIDLCTRFHIDTAKQAPRSPMSEGLSLPIPTADSIDTSIQTPLRSLIYSLLWLTRTVRPDIYYHVTYLAQFCHQPTVEALTAAKRILHYLYSTRQYTLSFTHDPTQPQFNVYCDSDHASDTATRNSVSGYCLYFHGMLIDWWSKKQKSCTALHSTEAEYIAMSEACTSALAIYNTVSEYFEITDLITINVDNSAVQHIVGQRALSTKLKHVSVRYHAVRQWCQGPLKLFRPVWIPTDENPADIFTKSLPTTKHGVPIIDKFTARLLDIGDRAVKLKEQLQSAAAQKLRTSEQQLQKQQAQDQLILASLRRQNLIG